MNMEPRNLGPTTAQCRAPSAPWIGTRDRDQILDISRIVLARYSEHPGAENGCDHDPGPILLAASLLDIDPSIENHARAALDRWLAELPPQIGGVGPFGGVGGYIAALRAACRITEEVEPLLNSIVTNAPAILAGTAWRSRDVRWRDYDYFSGPSGYLLAAGSVDVPCATLTPALDHILDLCASDRFDAFRGGTEIDARSAFNIGRINTGLAHGLTGVMAALNHVAKVMPENDRVVASLRNVATWVAREVFVDPSGLVTWPPVGAEGRSVTMSAGSRQAWCYGTPGVAWSLWDSSQTIGDPDLAEIASVAMASFCECFDIDVHIDKGPPSETLSFCHGAVGTLAVADAFCRHVGLQIAAPLRDELLHFLLNQRRDLVDLADRDQSALTGAAGIMALLLTAAGADRSWLHLMALR